MAVSAGSSEPSKRAEAGEAQKRVVISLSGNLCAYPDCELQLTIREQHPGDRPKAIGKVAHIAAASPGGPRYDPAMTDAQRGSANNLMYLCGSHHDAIDGQLNFHTTEYLHSAKRTHEAAVARAVRDALGDVTFEELEVVCAVISVAPIDLTLTDIQPPLPALRKIEFNGLGASSAARITTGLAQTGRVGAFLEFQNQTSPGFAKRLAARFRAQYHEAISHGLETDDIFDYLVDSAYENSGPRDTPRVRAAALAVVAHLFEICEVFERE